MQSSINREDELSNNIVYNSLAAPGEVESRLFYTWERESFLYPQPGSDHRFENRVLSNQYLALLDMLLSKSVKTCIIRHSLE